VSGIEYLTLEDAFYLIRALNVGPIIDLGLLDSAMHRPRASAFGEDAYPDLATKAAALLHSLTKNHCLADGNKRIAWLATVVFLDINGFGVTLSDDEAFELVWDIASGTMELSTIVSRLRVSPHG
jgi:death-on-curing protein